MFLSFHKEIIDTQCFFFILVYRITHEHNNRNRTKWITRNSIKLYKTEILVHLLSPYETKETFRTT